MHQKEMLPRNFPKFGGFLVNRATRFSGIELEVQIHKPRLGCIIPFDGLVANALIGNQFERRLKEVDVKP